MYEILEKLVGGDRRSIGRANEVVADVLNNPSLFGVVFDGMSSEDPLIRMRSADAVEKVTAKHPEYLQPYKEKLIREVAGSEQQEVRWHVAQMLPRLNLDRREREVALSLLLDYLKDESSIVRTSCMQALADLAKKDAALHPRVIDLLRDLTRSGTPAMKSRGRKLLEGLDRGTS